MPESKLYNATLCGRTTLIKKSLQFHHLHQMFNPTNLDDDKGGESSKAWATYETNSPNHPVSV